MNRPAPVCPLGFRAISRDEFFATVGQLNVHPSSQDNYPYTSFWKTPNGQIMGKTIQYHPDGHIGKIATLYCVPNAVITHAADGSENQTQRGSALGG
jgi:hypothetical protein